ncbi:metal-sulfur cluster assembly factor [Companilactobacillus keshanensis]|uniref:Metal-sulfur cluster assembly factor n=1 Tax=Companilactobacillus keshanensis TaxID=2486003 RepID=A0ABW4BW70_9LACO|nr:metal-sulfur cluster assembly factor [Companilactobacillus keshanensis]
MVDEMRKESAVTDLQDRMLEQLSKVIDPELRIDLVNLGLIYGLSMDDNVVTVTMTLTTMGCPISAVLEQMIQSSLEKLPEVDEVKINIVWEPAWSPDKMSQVARMTLGYYN